MPNFNPKIDEYISKSADFAKPILNHLRQIIHETCPDVEEVMKWSFPHFDYKGEMMCSYAAFKGHCAFNLWKASLMSDPKLVENAKTEQSMGHMGRITSLANLPSDEVLRAYIKEAMELNEKGIKIKKPKIEAAKELSVPQDLIEGLNAYPIAKEHFEQGTYSFKKEYISWLEDAKTEATRAKRLQTTLQQFAKFAVQILQKIRWNI
jgi:uncharacterized protein YdeI (YjbR/CyaY-like superfamily)